MRRCDWLSLDTARFQAYDKAYAKEVSVKLERHVKLKTLIHRREDMLMDKPGEGASVVVEKAERRNRHTMLNAHGADCIPDRQNGPPVGAQIRVRPR